MSMGTRVARAFLNMQLSLDQRASLRVYERSGKLPPGRYLSASEICRRYGLKPGAVPDVDIRAMDDLWNQYERTLRKQRKVEDRDHDLNCQVQCRCPDPASEIHDWEDYALKHFGNSAAA